MDDTLKRNIRKTVLFMLATACVPWLCLPLALIPDLDRSSDSYWIVLLAVAELVYILGCLFVLVWGSSQVIWKLPFGKVWRKVLFFAWLIIYPVWCWIWAVLCILCLNRLIN
jgi:hypothetical protein